MDDIMLNDSKNEILFLDRILREDMNVETSKRIVEGITSPRNDSVGVIPPHKYRFQSLRSYTSTNSNQFGEKKMSSSNDTSVQLEEFSSKDKTQPHQVKTRSIWCGGPFFCIPRKNKDNIKKPIAIIDKPQTSPFIGSNEDNESHTTYSSNKLSDERNDESLIDDQLYSKDSQIHILTEQNIALKNKNMELTDEYNKLMTTVKEQSVKGQTDNHHLSTVNILETQLEVANQSINKYIGEIKEQQKTLDDMEEKLNMSTITEDLLFNKKKKDHEKVKNLKEKHEQEIEELQSKIESLELKISEQAENYSSCLQKMNSCFDKCKLYQDENTELHGDLEYTIYMIESFLSNYKQENETLKKQSTDYIQLIKDLRDELEKKSLLVDKLTTLINELPLEKLEPCYSRSILNFKDELCKLEADQTTTSSEDKLSDEKVESENVVPSIVDEILDNITNNENKIIDPSVSLTVASRSTDGSTNEKGTFELESVSVEKVSKSSQTD